MPSARKATGPLVEAGKGRAHASALSLLFSLAALALLAIAPSASADIVFGARAMLLLDEVQARYVSERWEAGESSLLEPLVAREAVS